MKKTIKCEVCSCEFEIEEDVIKEKYIQCPMCGKISKNPLKK